MAHTHQLICQLTITRVAAVVTRLWPASRVEVFGSFASGLWMPSSDIDLVIVGVNYGARGRIFFSFFYPHSWVPFGSNFFQK
jgi:predicted nucleotidyltransferase